MDEFYFGSYQYSITVISTLSKFLSYQCIVTVILSVHSHLSYIQEVQLDFNIFLINGSPSQWVNSHTDVYVPMDVTHVIKISDFI
jgi:hypothetical protein